MHARRGAHFAWHPRAAGTASGALPYLRVLLLAVLCGVAVLAGLVPLAVILGALLLWWCGLEPRVGLLAATVAVPWQRTDLPATRWLSGIAVLGGLAASAPAAVGRRWRGRRLGTPLYIWAAVLLLIYALISLLVQGSLQPGFRLTGLGGLIFGTMSAQALALALSVGWLAGEHRALRSALAACFAQAALLAVAGLQEVVTGTKIIEFFGPVSHTVAGMPFRISSVFYDANLFANYIATVLFLAAGVVLADDWDRRLRQFACTALGLGVPALLLSRSLGTLTGCVAGLGVLAAVSRKRIVAVALAFACMGVLAFWWVPASRLPAWLEGDQRKLHLLVTEGYSPTSPSRSISSRAILAEAAMDMFRQAPVFGHGYGSYQIAMTTHPSGPSTSRGGPMTYPHNSYLLLLAEQGLLGAALLVVLLVAYFRTAVPQAREESQGYIRALHAATAGAVTQCLVFSWSYGSLMYNLNIWFAVGLTTALCALQLPEVRAAQKKARGPASASRERE